MAKATAAPGSAVVRGLVAEVLTARAKKLGRRHDTGKVAPERQARFYAVAAGN